MASPGNRARNRAIQRALTRAIKPTLGNLISYPTSGQKGGPKAGTMSVQYQTPHAPQMLDNEAIEFAGAAFNMNVFVMRCVETIATTIAGLPFKAGTDPFNPGEYDAVAPLAQLLGPATPQAPGGPNPGASSRMFWDWSIKQYVCYGRWGWETQLAKMPTGVGRQTKKQIVALWPLVAKYLTPIPTDGGQQMFEGYQYNPQNRDIRMTPDECFYAWKPSIDDWRQPESVLSAAKLAISIATGLDRYMDKLLQNDMVATTMVVSPPFDEGAGRRAFRNQFRSRFTGIDHAGGTIFAEAERDDDDTTGQPLLQIERIAQTAVEASTISISQQAKIDITIALGVPMSLIGNASQRTYANADSEYKNFWTLRILPMISDIQDYVNTYLAPRVGGEVGWFDLSKVEALKPAQPFAPPMVGDLINFEIADAAQIANVLGIPAANSTDDSDTYTVDVGVESAHSTSIGGRSEDMHELYRVTKGQMLEAHTLYRNRPLNTFNVDDSFVLQHYIRRERIDARHVRTPQATAVAKHVERIRTERNRALAEQRSAALVERTQQMATELRAAALETRRGGLRVPQKCKYCKDPATKATIWAEGAAYVPTCDEHQAKAVKQIGGPNEVNKTVDLPQKDEERDLNDLPYYEGVIDRLDGKPKQGVGVYATRHEDASSDDYVAYAAGFDGDGDLVLGPDDEVVRAGPAGSLSGMTTWDGNDDTFDAWVDANSDSLEAMANAPD